MNQAVSTFEAQVFHPSLGNEVAAGHIVVDRWHFHFQSPTVSLDIPLPRLKARMGQGDDERIIFFDSAHPEWEVYTLDERILDDASLQTGSQVREMLGRQATQLELKRRLRQLAWVIGVCAVLVWLGQFVVSAMVHSLVARLPASVERRIGDEAMSELQDEMMFLEDSNRVAHLAAVAAPLVNSLGLGTNIQFYIAQLPDPNAFALPGGHVVVTTGMLLMCDRPEQLLGVLAHEFAHVTQKHAIRKAVSSAGPFLILRVFLGGGGGMSRLLGGASDLLIRSSFSQAYEAEADEAGWRSLVAARIDPRGMRESFEKLQSYVKSVPNGMELPEAFASHPAIPKRIARLEANWKKLPARDGFRDLQPLQSHLKAAAGF